VVKFDEQTMRQRLAARHTIREGLQLTAAEACFDSFDLDGQRMHYVL
jgi:hypothetical protein